jgi:alpha-beta hydrolase superfamily lysophospholipase
MHIDRLWQQQKRPLVLVGHSMGGIVIKQALVTSASQDNILSSTKLIVFLGTPHRGSHLLDKSFSRVYLSMMKLGNKEIPKNIKTVLQPRGSESFAVNSDFMRVKGNIHIVNFYEQVPTQGIQDLVSFVLLLLLARHMQRYIDGSISAC